MVTLDKEEIQQAVNKANLDADKEYQSKIPSLSLFILMLMDNLTLFSYGKFIERFKKQIYHKSHLIQMYKFLQQYNGMLCFPL